MTEDKESTVEDYVRSRFRVRADDDAFTRDINLWEAGYVDSAGAVEMIAYLERTFAITLPEEILFDPDFTHVRGIARLIARQAG